MRLVQWEDEDGYLRQSWIKDGDPDEMARSGIRHEPPDISRIDWEAVRKEIHNGLVRSNLVTWKDVMQQQNTLLPTVSRVIKRHLIALYKEKM